MKKRPCHIRTNTKRNNITLRSKRSSTIQRDSTGGRAVLSHHAALAAATVCLALLDIQRCTVCVNSLPGTTPPRKKLDRSKLVSRPTSTRFESTKRLYNTAPFTTSLNLRNRLQYAKPRLNATQASMRMQPKTRP